MSKFYNINPETCSIEELKASILECERKEEFYGTMEQACKIFINSIYGAIGSDYYNCKNKDIAESVTLQGQHLIKHSVKKINEYFKTKWATDYDAHMRVANKMKEKFPDFNVERFLELAKQPVLHLQKFAKEVMDKEGFEDTCQVYGDSISGDSMITVDGYGDKRIDKLFEENISTLVTMRGKDFVTCPREIINANTRTGKMLVSKIKHIIRHRTRKRKYEIVAKGGKSVIVTSDHSVMIYNGNEYVKTKPENIKRGDLLCVIRYSMVGTPWFCMKKEVERVHNLGSFDNEYVYDIEVETDSPYEHNFFANGILVHNTDSVSYDSIIRTEKHPEGITIAEWYEENIINAGEETLKGHECVHTDDKALNWKDGTLYYSDVARIIRHKVSKPKWELKTFGGKRIDCTADHSLVVFTRNLQPKHVKPSEVKSGAALDGDTVCCATTISEPIAYWDKVKSCECIGNFEDEYVYDIEMADDTHTFMCNNVLVHNSAYLSLQFLVDACQIPREQETDFDLAIFSEVLEGYLPGVFDDYAKSFNCKENLEVFELEKIARTIIMLAKKMYIFECAWKEPNVHVAPLHSIVYKGIEIARGATPDFCRNALKDFINFILTKSVSDEGIQYTEIMQKLMTIKNSFVITSPNDTCKTLGINNYEKFILDDKSPDGVKFCEGVVCPMQVRAAAEYNNRLYTSAKKYKSKYSFIRNGDKAKVYYTAGGNVFAFIPNEYPAEFAPPMDVDVQFEKMILDPLNRIIEAGGYEKVPKSLYYVNSLF